MTGVPPEAVLAALRRGDTAAATRLAEQALARGVVHPLLYDLRARRAQAEGRLAPALHDFRIALGLAPESAELRHVLAQVLVGLGCGREALAAWREAVALRPAFGAAWFGLGMAEVAAGEVAAARESLTRAAEHLPAQSEPLGQLAGLAARRGDWTEAQQLAQAALAIDAKQASATRVLAEVDLHDGRLDAAAERLTAWLATARDPGPARRLALGLLGDVRERQGRYAEAFQVYAGGNTETRRRHLPALGRADLPAALGRLQAQLDLPASGGWSPSGEEAASPAARHVFLMGFMRSGTTLLEQAFAARDDVVTLEEQEALTSGVQAFLGDGAGLARLRDADEATLAVHRADYWAQVRSFGVAVEGKVFVDKNPFNGVKLALIWRLFPQARIVFSLRQPQDVVLSCFKHRFAVNSYTFQLLDLHTAARFYDSYMRLVRAQLALLPIGPLVYRHEDLVEDFRGGLERICAHVGLDLREEMFDIGVRVREGRVSSPSAVQLRDGLSRQGLQTWRRYADALAPVQPILQPWSRLFGYEHGGAPAGDGFGLGRLDEASA